MSFRFLGKPVEAQHQLEPVLVEKGQNFRAEKSAVGGQNIAQAFPGIPLLPLQPPDRPADQVEGQERFSSAKLDHRG